ncbi:hypothetical protein AURDEDRAFT_165801 [Auricularia subglabra TFB-10046 SS5]|nr:hypothetical protein AURDEDRAFT_165801 [Auricularia subglabra TFB-10046 SS5]
MSDAGASASPSSADLKTSPTPRSGPTFHGTSQRHCVGRGDRSPAAPTQNRRPTLQLETGTRSIRDYVIVQTVLMRVIIIAAVDVVEEDLPVHLLEVF